ncbi:MAG: MBL fold metallo-hydrolase [Candidatus Marinimicrobia bacterium]|nr:MBL fold metallo-hydrolase [Candidatus Neomarinimicrobiota bacterium]
MKINIHKITAGPFQENGYIIHCDDNLDCFIIDPGDKPELYIKEIEDNDLNPIAILNTHGHIDHVHAVQPLKEYYSIPFYIHKNEKMIVDHYSQGCLMYGLTPNEKPIVDKWLTNENNLTIGDYNLKVIHTPGHTPGGVCYQLNGDIFTGDTLFKGSIGRTDFPGGDYNTLMDSLKLLIEKVNGNTQVHSGHGYSTTIENEISSNPFLMDL